MSDTEIEAFLRFNPEPCTPTVSSLTPRAVRITVRAANEPALDVEAAIKRMLPWLQDYNILF